MIVCDQAPLSCHIWFICKGVLIFSRPVVSDLCLTTTKTSSSSKNGGGTTLIHDPEESMDVKSYNVQRFEHSTRLIEDIIVPFYPSAPPLESGDSSLHENVDFIEHLPCSSSKSSLDYKIHQKEIIDLGDGIEHVMKVSENLNQRLFEESLKRWRAEEDAFDAVRRAKEAESRYKEEMKRRQEVEYQLITQNQEIQSMKNQLDQCLKELQLLQDQKPALENRLNKARCTEKELEDKIVQAVNLLITFKETRDKLQIEYNSAIRKINKFMALAREGASGQPSAQFFEISFSDIIDATQNFNPSCRIGEGRNGSVFKGMFCHVKVAIKMLPSSGSQSDSEFKHEVEVLSRIRHPNLVTLIGACPESRTLIYEFIENGSLEDYVSGELKTRILSWQTRIRIAIEICCALIFLHANDTCNVHGNLKPSKILLDLNFVCKISDFGIKKLISQNDNPCTGSTLNDNDDPKISAYLAPEILENRVATTESDVYSFGIILLRLLTSRPAMSVARDVKCALERGCLDTILDLSAGDWPVEQVKELADLALRCCEKNYWDRPDLESEVWAVLEPLKDFCNVPQLTSTSHCSNSSSQHRVPSHFVCPIFQEVMKDPCIAADGFTYEADAIKGWINSGHMTSPMTNLKLENTNLLPNYALYHAIQEWQQHS